MYKVGHFQDFLHKAKSVIIFIKCFIILYMKDITPLSLERSKTKNGNNTMIPKRNTTPFRTTLPWIKEGAVVEAPLIKLYGAKTVGKDEITNALKKESCRGEKVRNVGVWRGIRQGEELLDNPGIDPGEVQDILGKKVLAFYPSNGVFYFILEERVTEITDLGKTPVLHIGSRYGVPSVEDSGKFPCSLNVLLTMDTTRSDITDDLRTRAIWRLAKYKDAIWKHGANWDYETGTPEDKEKVDAQVQKALDSILWLQEGQKIVPYHAIFENNRPTDNDVRCYIQERIRDKDVVTRDIAHRINELFRRFKEKLDSGVPYDQINFAALHKAYTRDCLGAVFGKDINLRKGTTLDYEKVAPALERYADTYGLTQAGLVHVVQDVRVASSGQSQIVRGRQDIFLTSNDTRPILITDIQAEHFYSTFHVLGVIAEAVFQSTGTLPQYQVENDVVNGMTFSLTDRSIGNKRNQIFIGYR